MLQYFWLPFSPRMSTFYFCANPSSQNSVNLRFTNIQGLRSDFFACKSFLESSSPDILALCETDLKYSFGSINFSLRGYLHLIQKDSFNHTHGLTVYVKEGLFCMLIIP